MKEPLDFPELKRPRVLNRFPEEIGTGTDIPLISCD